MNFQEISRMAQLNRLFDFAGNLDHRLDLGNFSRVFLSLHSYTLLAMLGLGRGRYFLEEKI